MIDPQRLAEYRQMVSVLPYGGDRARVLAEAGFASDEIRDILAPNETERGLAEATFGPEPARAALPLGNLPPPTATPSPETVRRKPTIGERLSAQEAAGQPRRLGGPTAEDTVIPEETARAFGERQVGRGYVESPIIGGVKSGLQTFAEVGTRAAAAGAPDLLERAGAAELARRFAERRAGEAEAGTEYPGRAAISGLARFGTELAAPGIGRAGRLVASAGRAGPGTLRAIGRLAARSAGLGTQFGTVSGLEAAGGGESPAEIARRAAEDFAVGAVTAPPFEAIERLAGGGLRALRTFREGRRPPPSGGGGAPAAEPVSASPIESPLVVPEMLRAEAPPVPHGEVTGRPLTPEALAERQRIAGEMTVMPSEFLPAARPSAVAPTPAEGARVQRGAAPPPTEGLVRRIENGEGLPAVRDDTGGVWSRRTPAEHGDLKPWAEEQGASFTGGPEQSGWLLDRKFVSVADFDAARGEMANARRVTVPRPPLTAEPGVPLGEPAPEEVLAQVRDRLGTEAAPVPHGEVTGRPLTPEALAERARIETEMGALPPEVPADVGSMRADLAAGRDAAQAQLNEARALRDRLVSGESRAPRVQPLSDEVVARRAAVAGMAESGAPRNLYEPGTLAARAYDAGVEHGPAAPLKEHATADGLVRSLKREPEAPPESAVKRPLATTVDRPLTVEAGAPHNATAVQEGLLGGAEVTARPQGELLPETAGVPTAAIRSTKIQPEEAGRLLAERGRPREPIGQRPLELGATEAPPLPVEPTPRMAAAARQLETELSGRRPLRPKKPEKMSDEELVARHVELEDRIAAASRDQAEGIKPWARKGERGEFDYTSNTLGSVPSGTAITNRAGRAIGAVNRDARLLEALDTEAARRNLDLYARAQDVRYEQAMSEARAQGEVGAATPEAVRTLARAGTGAVVGGAVGAQVDDEHPGIGMGFGALAGGLLALGVRLPPRARRVVATGLEMPEAVARESSRLGPAREAPPTSVAEITGTPADYQVHLNRIRRDPLGAEEIAQRVERLRAAGALPEKQAVSFEETRRQASRVEIDRVLRQGKNNPISGPEGVALADAYNGNEEWLRRAYERMGTLPATSSESAALQADIGALETYSDAVLARYVPGLSATARALNAAKIQAARTLDPLFWQARLARAAGGVERVSDVMRAQLRDLLAKGDREGVVELVAKAQRAMPSEKAMSGLRAILLSGPAAVGRSVLGNAARAGTDFVAGANTYAWDRGVFGLITGLQTHGVPWSPRRAGVVLQAMRRGAGDAKRILGGSLPESTLRKLDTPRQVNYENPVLDRVVKFPFVLQGASDVVYSTPAYANAIRQQAEIGAAAQGLKGEARRAFIEGFERAPPVDAVALAEIARAQAGFQQPSVLGTAAKGVRQGLGRISPAARFFFDVNVPFSATPGAVTGAAVGATPFGAVKTVGDIFRLWRLAAEAAGNATPEQLLEMKKLQWQAARHAGRWSSVGLAAFGGGYWMYRTGLMTGALPSDPGERETFLAQGKRPYAIRMGSRYVPVNQAQPIAGSMVAGARLAEAAQEEDASWANSVGQSAAAVGRSIIETPFFQGTRNFIDALGEGRGSTVNRYFQGLAGMASPTILADLAYALDPYYRMADNPLEALERRLPGVSRTLEPRINPATGEPVARSGAPLTRTAEAFFNVPGESIANDDLVLGELARVGVGLPRLRRRTDENEEAFTVRQQRAGHWIAALGERVILDPQYQGVSALEDAARRLIAEDPKYQGRSVAQVVRELQRDMLQSVVGPARRTAEFGAVEP